MKDLAIEGAIKALLASIFMIGWLFDHKIEWLVLGGYFALAQIHTQLFIIMKQLDK